MCVILIRTCLTSSTDAFMALKPFFFLNLPKTEVFDSQRNKTRSHNTVVINIKELPERFIPLSFSEC